jgi:hypothetical protein
MVTVTTMISVYHNLIPIFQREIKYFYLQVMSSDTALLKRNIKTQLLQVIMLDLTKCVLLLIIIIIIIIMALQLFMQSFGLLNQFLPLIKCVNSVNFPNTQSHRSFL